MVRAIQNGANEHGGRLAQRCRPMSVTARRCRLRVFCIALSMFLSVANWRALPCVGNIIGVAMAQAQSAPRAPKKAAKAPAPAGGWQSGTTKPPVGGARAPATTVIVTKPGQPSPRAAAKPDGVPVILVAVLTEDGQQIDRGLVWRIFELSASGTGNLKLLVTSRKPAPRLELVSGKYVVNAAFGRAHLTRTITVKVGDATTETFVLNAGGLQIKPVLGTLRQSSAKAVRYDIYSDERDEFGKRTAVLLGARPSLIIRLNAGIYHIVSTYGDANAIVRSDVTVEAGKLTQVTVRHTASRVTFKLVRRPGGEALADTKWRIATPSGQVIKKSFGALPTHVLAAGRYVLNATYAGKSYQREFTLQPGEITYVEVVLP